MKFSLCTFRLLCLTLSAGVHHCIHKLCVLQNTLWQKLSCATLSVFIVLFLFSNCIRKMRKTIQCCENILIYHDERVWHTNAVLSAFHTILMNSCLLFRCHSYMGKQGKGPQPVFLAENCLWNVSWLFLFVQLSAYFLVIVFVNSTYTEFTSKC